MWDPGGFHEQEGPDHRGFPICGRFPRQGALAYTSAQLYRPPCSGDENIWVGQHTGGTYAHIGTMRTLPAGRPFGILPA